MRINSDKNMNKTDHHIEKDEDSGSVLVTIIFAITIISVMGAGALYFTTSSAQTGLFSNS